MIIKPRLLWGFLLLTCIGCGGGAQSTPDWNYVFYRADDSGFPLNPPWGYQIHGPFTSNCGDRRSAACTNQPLEINWDWGQCGMWGYGGHWNHRTVTYEGLICWDSHSGSDDDYNVRIYRPDNATFEPGAQTILAEFDSDEVIDPFGTPWWTAFHNAVDDSDARAGAMINGKQAIIIGTLGFDCAHSCSVEIHPVMAMAIHVNSDPSDDTWAFFVRNWGDEGYCGNFVEEEPQREFTFRLPMPKGAQLSGPPDGSSIRAFGGANDSWSFDPLPAENAVLVTFNIEPFSKRDLLKGEIHFKWQGQSLTGSSPWDWDELWRSWPGQHPAWVVAPPACMGAPTAQQIPQGISWARDISWRPAGEQRIEAGEHEPEMLINEAISNMTPEQRKVFKQLWPRTQKPADPVRQVPPSATRLRDKSSAPTPKAMHHDDPEYIWKLQKRNIAIRTALGPEVAAKLPLPQPDQIGKTHDHK